MFFKTTVMSHSSKERKKRGINEPNTDVMRNTMIEFYTASNGNKSLILLKGIFRFFIIVKLSDHETSWP